MTAAFQTMPPSQASLAPLPRIVLLGASNLTRGISTVVETAQGVWGRPLQVFAALGHGRSYGVTSRVFGRSLPGIRDCGLWQALAEQPPRRTAALVTDVGNDLLFGSSVSRVADWVHESIERLSPHAQQVVLTRLPVASVQQLSPRRFAILRRLFVPGCTLSLPTLVQRAEALDERLAAMARSSGVTLVEPRSEWYGWDPIHVRRRLWREAWGTILAPWDPSRAHPRVRGSWRRWTVLRSLAPAERGLWGRTLLRSQPCRAWADGTLFWYF